jgi:hypothetical protein
MGGQKLFLILIFTVGLGRGSYIFIYGYAGLNFLIPINVNTCIEVYLNKKQMDKNVLIHKICVYIYMFIYIFIHINIYMFVHENRCIHTCA